jgi:hypothetical protein
VRFDSGRSSEGKLRDDAARVAVEDAARDPDRSRRSLGPPVADAEAEDLDRHFRPSFGG